MATRRAHIGSRASPNPRGALTRASTEASKTEAPDARSDEVAQRAAKVLESTFYSQGSYIEPTSAGPETQRGPL